MYINVYKYIYIYASKKIILLYLYTTPLII